MTTTRRSFLKFAGGATAGAVFSPLPWKLLDDVSIWTQNWSWVPQVARGPISHLDTTCTLCPAGCGLRLRLAGRNVVAAGGISGHPLSGGRLCPIGLGAAQLPYHPARIAGAVYRDRGSNGLWRRVDQQTAIDEVGRKLAEIRARGAQERLGLLDLRPGRGLSVLYGEFLAAAGGGRYLTLPGGREQAAAALGDLLDLAGTTPGYEPVPSGAVISLGAPVLDGWAGTPAAPLAPTGAADPGRVPLVIQVQTNGSAGTGLADRWLPIRPGSEAPLVLGLAHVLEQELGVRPAGGTPENEFWATYRQLVARSTPARVAAATAIAPELLRAAARDLARRSPVVVVGGGDPGAGPLGRGEELAVWALNLALGSVGRPGGVALRRDIRTVFGQENPAAGESLWEVPDGSLDLLLVDGMPSDVALPDDLLRRKMSGPGSLVVGMSAFAAGPVAGADLILPTAAPGEWLDDVPPRALAARTAYALSPAVGQAPAGAQHPADLLARLAAAAGLGDNLPAGRPRHAEILNRRLQSLIEQDRGEVFDPARDQPVGLQEIASPARLEKILAHGGCWSEPAPAVAGPLSWRQGGNASEPARCLAAAADGRLPAEGKSAEGWPLVLMIGGSGLAVHEGALPPVVNKLFRESGLRTGADTVRVNPVTARARGCPDGQPRILATEHGSVQVKVVHDESVMPGVVLAAAGPDPASLGDPDENKPGDILKISGCGLRPVWRTAPAALREV